MRTGAALSFGRDRAVFQEEALERDFQWIPPPMLVSLRHEQGGPIINISCREFQPAFSAQVQLFGKESTG